MNSIRILFLILHFACAALGLFWPWIGGGLAFGLLLLLALFLFPFAPHLSIEDDPDWSPLERELLKKHRRYFAFPVSSRAFSGIYSGFNILFIILGIRFLIGGIWIGAGLTALGYFFASQFAAKLNPKGPIEKGLEDGVNVGENTRRKLEAIYSIERRLKEERGVSQEISPTPVPEAGEGGEDEQKRRGTVKPQTGPTGRLITYYASAMTNFRLYNKALTELLQLLKGKNPDTDAMAWRLEVEEKLVQIRNAYENTKKLVPPSGEQANYDKLMSALQDAKEGADRFAEALDNGDREALEASGDLLGSAAEKATEWRDMMQGDMQDETD